MAKKRRTAAQIRATKKLVAMNKARSKSSRKNPKILYEITTPGRDDERLSMNVDAGSLAEARKVARELARRYGKPMLIERVTASRGKSTVVESVRPGKSNPSRSKKKAKKKAAGQMKRAGSALAKWVRSGMPSYSNRPKKKKAQCNPRHKRQKTITVQQAVKLAKAARAGRAVGIKTNPSGKCSVVTGKAARALGKKA